MARLTVTALKDMLGLEFAQLRSEIEAGTAALRNYVDREVGSLRGDMNRRFDRVDQRFDEMRAEFSGLRGEFNELKALIRTNIKRRKR